MSLNLGELVGYLKLDSTGWDKPLEDAQKSSKSFSDNVPGWMAATSGAVIIAAGAAAAALYGIGSAWDDVADTIRVGTGATGEALEDLTDSAKEVAKRVPAELDKIGPAVADLNTRLGLTGDTLETVAGQVLEAGRMLNEEVDVNAVADAFNAFNVSQDQMSAGLDYLWQVAQATGVSINDLAAQTAGAAPITQQLGFTFEETAGLISSMEQAGLDASDMIGAMQRGLADMTAPGQDASETFRTVVGQIQGFIAAGDDAAARDLAGQVFGTRGAASFVGALQSGAINLEDLANVAGMTGDTIMAASADTQDFAEKWQLVKNRASVALEPLGSMVFSALGDALERVMPYLESFAGWLEDNPAALQIMAAVLGVLTVAFVGLTVATWAMNTALLANPITWIVLAVVALIAIIVLLIANWDSVVAWLKDVWDAVVTWFKDTLDSLGKWWSSVWQGIKDFFVNLWTAVWDFYKTLWTTIIDWVVSAIEAYVGFWVSVWSHVIDFFKNAWTALKDWAVGLVTGWINNWRALWGALGEFLGELWDSISTYAEDKWQALMDFFGAIPGRLVGFFTGAKDWLVNAGRDVLEGLLSGAKNALSTVGEFFTSTLPDKIVGGFKDALGIHSPSRVFMAYGVNTLEGYLAGIESGRVDLDREMANLIDQQSLRMASTFSIDAAAQAQSGQQVSTDQSQFHYHAAENRSLSAEEELFAALAGPRGRGGRR